MKTANFAAYRGEDQLYHVRHHQRSLARAERMARFLPPDARILDVGCNQGLTSRLLLDRLPAAEVTGLELSRSTLDPELLEHPRFRFIETNVCDFSPDGTYDAVVYGAVHHHIVRERGLGEAIRVWRTLASACRGQLFFETGHLSEGSRWAWQRHLRNYFRSDEDHFHYLLRCIEDLIVDFEVIGRHWIHGAPRWLARIQLKARHAATEPAAEDAEYCLANETPFGRSFGSAGQRFLGARDGGFSDSPSIFYRVGRPPLVFFVKQASHSPLAIDREFAVGKSLDRPWAVRPNRCLAGAAIEFPWIEATKLSECANLASDARTRLGRQLLAIWDDCQRIPSGCPNGPLLHAAEARRLADIIDLNPNNLLVEGEGMGCTLRVVDFEPISNHYRWRNRTHVAQALFTLRVHRLRATLLGIAGAAGGLGHLIHYSFRSPKVRIRDKQPGLISILAVEVRSILDRALLKLFKDMDRL